MRNVMLSLDNDRLLSSGSIGAAGVPISDIQRRM